MRLTINLDPDLYGVAKSLARDKDSSISAAVNQLLRRAVTAEPSHASTSRSKRNGFVVSSGRAPITADTVRRVDAEDDA